MLRYRSFLAGALCATCLSLVSMTASAAPTFKEKQEAKSLVNDAKKAMKEGSYQDAVTALRHADELDPSLQTKLELAKGLVELSRLLEASQVLHAVADGGGTSWADKKTSEAARAMLKEVEPRVPWLQITVAGAPSATVTVDKAPFDAVNDTPINPGDHVIVAEAEGYERLEKKVKIADGEHKKVTLDMVAIAKPESETEKKKDEGGKSILPVAVAFGVGGVGVVVGSIFGIIAFGQTSDVEAACTPSAGGGSICPPTQAGALDDAKTSGTISTIGFVVGGVGIATGVVLLVTGIGSGKAKVGGDAASIQPWIGAGEAGVYGTF